MTGRDPRVSIILPNYNYGHFLQRRLNSILCQTFQDFEIIYLDDCSTDNSQHVLRSYGTESRIRSYHNNRNSGSPFIQINKGVRLARGELIWVAEADDVAHPEFLATLIAVLQQNPSAGLAYCQSLAIDAAETPLFSMRKHTDFLDQSHWDRDFFSSGVDECRRYLIYANTIPNFSAVVFRRAVFERAGYAEESMRLCGDWLTWIRMLLISDLAFVAEPLNYYRWHAHSVRTTTGMWRYIAERYRVFGVVRRALPLSEAEMDIVLAKIMKDGVRHVQQTRALGSLHDLSSVLRIADRSDPKFRRRLLWHLADLCSCGALRRVYPAGRDRLCPKLRPGTRVIPDSATNADGVCQAN